MASLARISGSFRSLFRSWKPNSGSGSGCGGRSRHNLRAAVSSAVLAFGRVRAHSAIQGIGKTCSSIELVLGRILQPSSSPTTDPVCLDDTSDVNGNEGALSNPESHTFCFPVVGVAGSLLQLRAGVCARMVEGYPGRSSVSASSSSSATCVRGRLESRRCHQYQGAAV